MDDFTINKILLSNKVTKDSFIGVFSSDTLPSDSQTGYYVVNLDMSQQPSSHWIATKISKSKCKNEYFDSYGLGPPTVCFKKFMKYNYVYNCKRLQHSLSTSCAQWCIQIQIARKTAEKTCIHNFLLLVSLQCINYIFTRMNMGKCMTEDTP